MERANFCSRAKFCSNVKFSSLQNDLCVDGTYQLELISPVDKEDIPASAVDFHVSSIVEELLNNDKILAKAKAHFS